MAAGRSYHLDAWGRRLTRARRGCCQGGSALRSYSLSKECGDGTRPRSRSAPRQAATVDHPRPRGDTSEDRLCDRHHQLSRVRGRSGPGASRVARANCLGALPVPAVMLFVPRRHCTVPALMVFVPRLNSTVPRAKFSVPPAEFSEPPAEFSEPRPCSTVLRLSLGAAFSPKPLLSSRAARPSGLAETVRRPVRRFG